MNRGAAPDAIPDLLEVLGRGGSSTVWRAWHRGRIVAIKRATPGDRGAADRLAREARLADVVDHPAVIRPLEFLTDADGPLLVLPFRAGGSLADRLARGGALAPQAAVRLGAQIADGLAATHGAGVVHRDVKPGNILLGADGAAALADFGVAVTSAEAATGAAPPAGSPAYVAPELLAGHTPSPRSDIFGLGTTLFEMLTGRLPLPARHPDALTLDALVPGLPPALVALVAACIDASPSSRCPSALAVRDELLRLEPQLEGWAPDADAALAAWWSEADPRVTRSFGPRPPASEGCQPAAGPPAAWVVAVAAAAAFAVPVASVGLLS